VNPPPEPEPLFDAQFEGCVIEWRGPAPFLFIPVPDALVDDLRQAARLASYGWGVVPVTAMVDGIVYTTSLFPRSKGYVLPVKQAVQKAANVGLGSAVSVRITVS
jgi:hypothetical protein